jgi:hypothetical protein
MHSPLLLRRSRLTLARSVAAATPPARHFSLLSLSTFSSSDSCKLPSFAEQPHSAHHFSLPALQTRALSSSDSYTLSSFAEPEPTLFVQQAAMEIAETDDPDTLLRSDIRTMGSLLGKVMEESTLHQVEGMRALAKKWRADKTPEALQALALYAANLDNLDLQRVSRAFTHFMALANAAEQHHRVRRLGYTTASSGLYNKPDSCGGVLPALLKEHEPEEIFEALASQMTELILTAHPTQGLLNNNRRRFVMLLDVF